MNVLDHGKIVLMETQVLKIARVGLPVLDLYAEPDGASEVVSQALYGWRVRLLEKQGDFLRLETADGYCGWAETRYLVSPESTQDESKRVKITSNAAPVYTEPDLRYRPLWVLPFEVELAVVEEPAEEERRWIRVRLVEGNMGWIQRGHVTDDLSPLSLDQTLRLSRQFLGLPYIWGGTSSFGFDCSGFIQMLWRQMHITVPRDARQQYPICRPLKGNDIAAGDLLFYGSSEEVITHVALYLGDRKLIHAAARPLPLLQETSLDSPDLHRRFAYHSIRHPPEGYFHNFVRE